ncbi:E3 ubiquitin-protein ligase ZFP91 isoform X1, partial [Tachysurus ichikawai]
MEVQRVDKKHKREEEEEAALTSPDSSVTRTPRRALRGRGATRPNSAAPPAASTDTNGTPSEAGCGRVLRDRSTRSVPVWRRRDLGVEQDDDDDDDDDDDEEEEEEEEAEARRRRKTACPRRRRNTEAARDSKAQYGNMSCTNTLKCILTRVNVRVCVRLNFITSLCSIVWCGLVCRVYCGVEWSGVEWSG